MEGPIDIVNVFRRSEQLPGVAEEFLQTDAPVFWAQQGLANEEAYRMITDKGRTAVMDLCIKVDFITARATFIHKSITAVRPLSVIMRYASSFARPCCAQKTGASVCKNSNFYRRTLPFFGRSRVLQMKKRIA